jgi:hypothetical protein
MPSGVSIAIGSFVPGTGLVPAERATCRAFILSPKASSVSGKGPMNVTPSAATARANALFSLRNPYPGCTASALVARMAPSRASMLKYESLAAAGPIATLSSASATWGASLSASE